MVKMIIDNDEKDYGGRIMKLPFTVHLLTHYLRNNMADISQMAFLKCIVVQ